jgi:hypothetical protein
VTPEVTEDENGQRTCTVLDQFDTPQTNVLVIEECRENVEFSNGTMRLLLDRSCMPVLSSSSKFSQGVFQSGIKATNLSDVITSFFLQAGADSTGDRIEWGTDLTT